MDKQDMAILQKARNNLGTFAPLVNRRYSLNWHHEEIIKALHLITSGKINRLMISMPPRHGKSELVTKIYPAWCHGRDPETEVIATSYNIELAQDFSRGAKDYLNSEIYQMIFDTKLSKDSKSAREWHTEERGSYIARGVGGGITGRGGNIIIIDDPFKDREEANSELQRQKVWDWYTSTLYTRLEKGGAIIIVMTRWHEDDLMGRLLAAEEKGVGDKWAKLILPAYNIKPEPFRPEIGTPLWPDKYDGEALENIKNTIGLNDWEALYQQNPLNEGGGAFNKEMFKSYNSFEIIDRKLNVYVGVDPAIATKSYNDYSSIVTIGVDKMSNDIHILDIFRDRVEIHELIHEIFNIVDKFEPIQTGIEGVAFQKMLIDEMKKQMRLNQCVFNLKTVQPMGAKNERIRAILQPRYANGWILHDSRVRNIKNLEEELLKFPNARHDDCIDALSIAIAMANLSSGGNKKKAIRQLKRQFIDPATKKVYFSTS